MLGKFGLGKCFALEKLENTWRANYFVGRGEKIDAKTPLDILPFGGSKLLNFLLLRL